MQQELAVLGRTQLNSTSRPATEGVSPTLKQQSGGGLNSGTLLSATAQHCLNRASVPFLGCERKVEGVLKGGAFDCGPAVPLIVGRSPDAGGRASGNGIGLACDPGKKTLDLMNPGLWFMRTDVCLPGLDRDQCRVHAAR